MLQYDLLFMFHAAQIKSLNIINAVSVGWPKHMTDGKAISLVVGNETFQVRILMKQHKHAT